MFNEFNHTHMPYVFYINGNKHMFFTVLLNKYWKLYYYNCNSNKVSRITTPFDLMFGTTNYHMCQPMCYHISGKKCQVSLCIQLNGVISLYSTITDSLTEFKLVNLIGSYCHGGCVTPNYVILNHYDNCVYMWKHSSKDVIDGSVFDSVIKILPNIRHLARVSTVFNNLRQILISYADPVLVHVHGTYYLDLDSGKQYHITSKDNKPVYKCTIDPITKLIYYGKKTGGGFELRKICKLSLDNVIFTESNRLKYKLLQ